MNSDSTDSGIELLAWLEVNKKRLAIGAVVALVVGFGIYIYNYMADQKETAASAALVALHNPVGATNEPPISSTAYLKVANDYPGSAAAERAIILAAGASFTDGKYTDAQNQFERLQKEHPSSKWAPDAAFGIAASLESQGKRDEAITAYQRVVTSYPNSSVVNEARLALARIYEVKGQPAEALKQYDDITRGGMMTMRSQEAIMRRSQLYKQHPELEKTATNSAPTITPMNLLSGTNKAAAPSAAAPMTKPTNSATTTPAAPSKK
jgi:predicted negative regulator of RcsB-dependent stress response